MMGSSLFAGAVRGLGRNALDLPVAALAGLSAAFVAFAAPGDILSQLVGATGLPSVLPAAEPPLGLKARTGLGAAGAIAVFFAVYLLLRMLDRFGARAQEEEESEAAAPRLRRRDFHPDAPSRRPLSAARDLGEPHFLSEAEPETASLDAEGESHSEWQPEPNMETEWQAEPEPGPATQPLWLSAEPAEPAVYRDPWEKAENEAGSEPEPDKEFAEFEEFEAEPESESEAEPEPESEPESQSLWGSDVQPGAGSPQAYSREPDLDAWREPEPQPEAWREPEAEAGPEPEPEPEPEAWQEAEPQPQAEVWPEPEPLPEPLVRKPKRPVIQVTDEVTPRPVVQPTDEVTPRPVVRTADKVPPRSAADGPCSIPELMERLERGLARRRYQTPVAAEPPQVFPESSREPPDDRLQSAIDSLHRLASRQN